jgi:alkylhydroperoxidase family enzyme
MWGRLPPGSAAPRFCVVIGVAVYDSGKSGPAAALDTGASRWSDCAHMSWIRTVAPDEATGLLRQLYREATRRAGKVYNVLRVQSPRPKVLKASTDLYLEVMFGSDSGLSRTQREMIATAVSRANECFY